MVFNSASFLFAFLPVVLIGFYLIGRKSPSLALLFLAFASLFFYAQTNPKHLYVMLPSILFNYFVGSALARKPQSDSFSRYQLLVLGVTANLLCLFTFKYLDLFIDAINATHLIALKERKIELPLGISFFTFTQIAFLVDAYARKAKETRLLDYTLFVTYFPHLIAGPILHHSEMMPQFAASTYRVKIENIVVGLTVFLIGLFKKVVLADTVAPHVHRIFDAAGQGAALTFLEGWSGALFYALQIYFDFSGYSDMAIGMSLQFGVSLPLNFNSPYKAANIIDFWRRWHMTLSRFLRDYLYIPLGGNRCGAARRMANLMIVMLLGGLWHGASWTFAIWGGLHGAYLLVNHAWQLLGLKFPSSDRAAAVLGCALTFLVVTVAWVFFRSPDIGTALTMLTAMLDISSVGRTSANLPSIELSAFAAALLAIAWFAPNTQEIMADYHPALGHPDAARMPAIVWRPSPAYALVLASMTIASFTMIVYVKRVGDFIYFQF